MSGLSFCEYYCPVCGVYRGRTKPRTTLCPDCQRMEHFALRAEVEAEKPANRRDAVEE
ncbi:unnamed protein product [marine sediment metagenome]|uniref:Uncharacterized protein n=1 Tax=marine sediment metagenome TaxID=412755 RepID=X0SV50_9ZZZZ